MQWSCQDATSVRRAISPSINGSVIGTPTACALKPCAMTIHNPSACTATVRHVMAAACRRSLRRGVSHVIEQSSIGVLPADTAGDKGKRNEDQFAVIIQPDEYSSLGQRFDALRVNRIPFEWAARPLPAQ